MTLRPLLVLALVASIFIGSFGQQAEAAVCGVSLSPKTATSPVGTSHTVTAFVGVDGPPASGVTVTFTVTAGPNIGKTGTGVTNTSGQTMFTYTSNGTIGMDTITGTAFVSRCEMSFTDNVSKIWTSAPPPPPASSGARLLATSPSCGQAVVTAAGVRPGLPHQIVVTQSTGGNSFVANVTADASQKVSATITTGGGTFTAYLRMTSNQVTVSNTATFVVAACPVATPTPTPTPTPARRTATPTPTPLALLPSTGTGDDLGLPISVLAVLFGLGAIALRRRYSRS